MRCATVQGLVRELNWSYIAVVQLTNVFWQEYNKERSDQVIDALHIATRWVLQGPDV